MKKSIVLFILTFLIFTSCVTSLHPITENQSDLVFKKDLLGTWVDKDSARYIIEEAKERGDKFYQATVIDPKKLDNHILATKHTFLPQSLFPIYS